MTTYRPLDYEHFEAEKHGREMSRVEAICSVTFVIVVIALAALILTRPIGG